MIRFIAAIALLGLPSACHGQRANQASASLQAATTPLAANRQAVTLRAADGVKVFADYYPVTRPKALILLFHQAGSSAAEYATIAPRLNDLGYSALAIDQRAGGAMFGRNRTVDALGGPGDFSSAKQDLAAAVDWARSKRSPIILWGSSYSAALVFLAAAAHHGDIKALLAFSPGEYLADKHVVETAAATLDIPVFITCAPTAKEIDLARPIADAVLAKNRQFYLPTTGIHGSSTLVASRDPAGAAQNWDHVEAFLASVVQ